MSDVQMQLAVGNCAAAIQDELGNLGATAKMSHAGVAVAGSVGVVLTGTFESVSINMNTARMLAQDEISGTHSTGLMMPVVGGIYVTWANPAAHSPSDG